MSAEVFITDIEEIKKLQDKLKSLKLSSSEERDILEAIGTEIKTQIEERFENQRDVSGNKWQDISQKTREYYNKKGIVGSILSRTRQLRDTIESQVNNSQLLTGATKVYAAVHNFGDDSRNIPQREFLGLSSDNYADIENIINEFLENSIKKANN
ncbi:putative phage virion morphogenesis protein [Brachyspira intermedia PWS/A]|uniref:Putative phage virion morphogenesis protein n=1 Tax=Brachyspira intermedia (strain ATCC 51140 / PWS/A) TaxID=1045858 RepID=G0EPL3_BRAIP|nr:phage virion morphogenesis protein [Brachyspira intermedia]AEM20727.1 putative phage virion morphogenesis protein [Brachyspira intermedia PWS/A]